MNDMNLGWVTLARNIAKRLPEDKNASILLSWEEAAEVSWAILGLIGEIEIFADARNISEVNNRAYNILERTGRTERLT